MSQAGYAWYSAIVSVQSRLNKGMVERVRASREEGVR